MNQLHLVLALVKAYKIEFETVEQSGYPTRYRAVITRWNKKPEQLRSFLCLSRSMAVYNVVDQVNQEAKEENETKQTNASSSE